MIRNIFLSLAFLLVAFLYSCSNQPQEVKLNILQTTDVHGTIYPYNFIEQKQESNSLATIYSLVKEKRAANPNGVILIDNGDYLQGQPTVYYYNFVDTTSPHLAAQVFNYMQYDAATVGNHDIETGHPVYDRFRHQINMPYLAANAVDTKTGNPYFKPYTVIERQGIKVAILGMITPGIPQWLPENLWSGMKFNDMIETAKKWVPIIMEKEHPDILIGMFHSGVDPKYNNPSGEEYMNENASQLVAEQVPGFDVVLAGHDHRKYNENVVNVNGDTVLLLDPRSHGRAVASIAVDLKWDASQKKYSKSFTPEIIEIKDQTPDADFMATFQTQFDTIKNYVSRQIGTFTESMDSKYAYFGNSAFIDLIQKIQLDISGADVSFTAPLSFHTKIEKGPVYVSDLFKLYKYENQLYTISLTGKEIDSYLEFSSALWFNQMKSTEDHLLKLKSNDEGKISLEAKYYSLSSAAGIDYLVNVSKPEGNRVKILGFSNGKHFYSDSTYTVALNSYRANGGGGHLTEGVGLTMDEIHQRFVKSSDYDLRYYLMKYIETNKTIDTEESSNWRIIPEDFYENGKRRDMQLLFGN